MKHLIIFTHPNNQTSFNQAILEQTVKTGQKLGVETRVRDLYALDFNPILSWEELQAAQQKITPAEIRYEQELIDQSDLITLIYPLWWMGFPAILKGYLDRILSHGVAYKTENGVSEGLLHGKKIQQFITMGNNLQKYQERGFAQSLQNCLVDGLFNYCGVTDIDHSFFGDIHILDEQAKQHILQEVREKTVKNLTALLALQKEGIA
ncbi:NAD(P)H-dependent oxidoreductase [Histophilus somni]|uniref:NAD(P)H-dependent oxidoreductase n=2 Tax=Histophilus somni TaxID=731 RepID=A0A9Q6Z0Z5_HISSO|nr:NAD(P)H-dependent oxidoreductase [Histophilus somni]ACA31365.1 NAD(P)H dehydrogenase (quinone) [Histophilus somni 2336]ARU64663.1 NAD(P)H oxidoreductase [Histophilus somni]ARU66528.1 NAD(P)H oxidoreductase [Histophilus somni]ARU68402.1 NAD(P)H oxidoreductase [Histophilus somni]ARU70281.1 NAD(P)H oxidoreductase [Histophilus somni]